MEDEIDLQRYILLLVNRWRLIIGISILLALAAALLSKFVLPARYEARALVVITIPRYSISFDPRFEFQNVTDLDFYAPLVDLAVSDDVIQELLLMYPDNEDLTLDTLRDMLRVESVRFSNSLQLIVTSVDPELSAELVNSLASVFVAKGNEIFGGVSRDTNSLDAQLVQFEADRQTAEQAFVEFESQNELLILQARLDAAKNVYDQILEEQRGIEQILQDVEGLRAQIATLPANQTVSYENDLTLLLLQVKAYNVDETTLLIQVDEQLTLSRQTVGETIGYLDEFKASLQQKSQALETSLEPRQAEVLDIQRKIKEMETERDQITQTYDLATQTHLALALQIEESKITSHISGNSIRLASSAAVPVDPIWPKTFVNALLGGAMGLMGGVFWVLIAGYWRQISIQKKEDIKSPKSL